jgi:predicted dehydrogenase
VDRRAFLKTASAAGAGLWTSASWSAAYGAPAGAPAVYRGAPNEKVVVAAMGVNSRGDAITQLFAATPNAEVGYVCDVDERAMNKTIAAVEKLQGKRPKAVVDVRRALEDKAVDALYIATPDHWHAPASVLAMAAGKHVYVEKPCGHNAREGEMLVAAQRRYGKVVQMGTQQRSAPRSIEVVKAIRDGLIGRAYFAHAWYTNDRKSIGRGKAGPVPSWLNYDLWQGPAPRVPFKDNVVHYNWHWFHHWGTGEICNNGTHELDVARWALGVDYPTRVSSVGGRYHFQDDWEFPDTQEASYDFGGQRSILWQGRSCNGFPIEGKGRGVTVHGTTGTVLVDRNGYTVYDLKKNKVRESIGRESDDGLNIRGADALTQYHILNFVDAIRTGARLNAPIEEGHKSTLLGHLGNIAQRVGRTLTLDPATGRIVGDAEAAKHWGREYAPGWAPVV